MKPTALRLTLRVILRATLPNTLLASLLAATGSAAQAQAFDAVRIFGPVEADGKGAIGAAVISAPEFLGSKQHRTLLLPAFDYRWKNGFFAGTSNGIGYLFSSAPQLQYGLRITADFGRKASRSEALNGLGDIDAAAQFGGFFNYLASPALSLTSSLRYGAGNDHKGMVIDLGANHAMQLAPQWRSAVGVAASFVNANSMQSAFGVTPAQAVTSGYAAYSPGAGFRDVRATASLNYFVNRQWAVTGVLSASALTGDARRSPIVRDRSSVTGVLALTREL